MHKSSSKRIVKHFALQKPCTPEGILSSRELNFCPLRNARILRIGVASNCFMI